MKSSGYVLSSGKRRGFCTENSPHIQNDEPSTSKNQKGQVLRTLHTVTENQRRMQEQLNEIQTFCDRPRDMVMDKMIRQNLVITKETFTSIRKLFGKGLTQTEEEMGSFFPLSSLPELEELENKLKDKTNEDAVKTYLLSKKGNQSLDSLFRNLITDEFLDAYNWDGRWGKNSLKNLRFFGVILNDVYCNLSKRDFETEIRKAIELSHNRAKQKKIKYQHNVHK